MSLLLRSVPLSAVSSIDAGRPIGDRFARVLRSTQQTAAPAPHVASRPPNASQLEPSTPTARPVLEETVIDVGSEPSRRKSGDLRPAVEAAGRRTGTTHDASLHQADWINRCASREARRKGHPASRKRPGPKVLSIRRGSDRSGRPFSQPLQVGRCLSRETGRHRSPRFSLAFGSARTSKGRELLP